MQTEVDRSIGVADSREASERERRRLRRVCAIVTDPLSFHSYTSLRHVVESGFEVPLVLVGVPETGAAYRRSKRPAPLQPFFNDWKLLWAASDLLLPRTATRLEPDLDSTWSLERLKVDVPALQAAKIIPVEYERSGSHTHRLSAELVDAIRATCDAVVLLGFNRILRGPVITAAPYGVLSLHPADTFHYRGRPHGFFEWLNREERIGFTIQRINDELDGGEVLLQRHVPLRGMPSRRIALAELWNASLPDMFTVALQRLDRDGPDARYPTPGPESRLHRQRDADRFPNAVRYAWRNLLVRVGIER